MNQLLAAGALLVLAACSEGNPVIPGTSDVVVSPSQSTYDRGATGDVIVFFTVTNHTSATVSLEGCGSGVAPQVQRLQDGDWTTVSGEFCTREQNVDVAPGASTTDNAQVAGPAGTYRIRVPYGAPGFQAVNYAASPSFRVR